MPPHELRPVFGGTLAVNIVHGSLVKAGVNLRAILRVELLVRVSVSVSGRVRCFGSFVCVCWKSLKLDYR